MKRHSLCVLLFCVALSFASAAHAQCTTPTVTSFTLTPSTISGDTSQLAKGTVQACVPEGTTNGLIIGMYPYRFSATETICYGPYHRFLIALHSLDEVIETGLPNGPPEKRAAKLVRAGKWDTFSSPV